MNATAPSSDDGMEWERPPVRTLWVPRIIKFLEVGEAALADGSLHAAAQLEKDRFQLVRRRGVTVRLPLPPRSAEG